MPQLYDLRGTYRTSSAEDTLRSIGPLAKIIGITRTANVTGLDTIGIPVWLAVRPLSKSLTVSQGKGANNQLAKISALMESIELFHAEHHVPSGRSYPVCTAWRDSDFLHPASLPIRADANVDANFVCEWIYAKSIDGSAIKLVPRELMDLDSCVKRLRLFNSSSNGLASGNCISEAILHGLCEIIERHELTFWLAKRKFFGKNYSSRINLESVDDAYCRKLVEVCEQAGLSLAVWYMSSSTSIPAFSCALLEAHNTFYNQRAYGHGAHVKKHVALARAITEALQSRLTHIAGSRDDVTWKRFRDEISLDGDRHSDWADSIKNESAVIDYMDIVEFPKTKFSTNEALDWIMISLSDISVDQVYYVDLTRSEYGIPVVFVIAPGLEMSASKPNYTPGRMMLKFLRTLE